MNNKYKLLKYKKIQPLTRTIHSSIIPMITEGRYAIYSIVSTAKYGVLISSAAQIIQPDWSSCATIIGIKAWDCTWGVTY